MTSVLKDSTYHITSITACPIRLAAILVIMSVSTFISAFILYLGTMKNIIFWKISIEVNFYFIFFQVKYLFNISYLHIKYKQYQKQHIKIKSDYIINESYILLRQRIKQNLLKKLHFTHMTLSDISNYWYSNSKD